MVFRSDWKNGGILSFGEKRSCLLGLNIVHAWKLFKKKTLKLVILGYLLYFKKNNQAMIVNKPKNES